MPQVHQAIRSIGTIVKVRTATGNDAVKASYTHAAGNQQIVFTAVVPGVGGNSITVEITDAGGGQPIAITVTGTAIAIAADLAADTILDVIAAIANDTDADALIRASTGAGNGTGLITALAETNLAGGLAATHTFVEIPGIGDITIPARLAELLDITSHSSPEDPDGSVPAEYIQSRKVDVAEYALPLTWWNPGANAAHARLAALEGGSAERFQYIFREGAIPDFECDYLVRGVEVGAPVNGVYPATVTVKRSGAITLL